MALQRTKLADIQFISATVAPLYTNPLGIKTYLKGVILFNSNVATEVVRLYVVPDTAGNVGTAATMNQIAQIGLLPNETVFFPLNMDGQPLVMINPNETFQASTTTASKVTALILGDKE
jgi:hypothetical protein